MGSHCRCPTDLAKRTASNAVLGVCSVFAGGFDADAVTAVCGRVDDYAMLDVLDSLVRKSLVTVSRVGGRTRYGLLETIRQFAEDQHAHPVSGAPADTTSDIGGTCEVRHRHARYFAGSRWRWSVVSVAISHTRSLMMVPFDIACHRS